MENEEPYEHLVTKWKEEHLLDDDDDVGCCNLISGSTHFGNASDDHSGMAQPTPPDPPLAFGEELTHTNADLSHLILDGLRGGGADIPRLPRAVPVSSVDRRFVSSLDPDSEGLVRVEVLGLGPPEIGGLGKHELRVELHESSRPPHAVVVSTDAPADALPERWEADVPQFADLATLRAEHCAREDSLVVTVALLC